MKAKQNKTKLWSAILLILGILVAFVILNLSDFTPSLINDENETHFTESSADNNNSFSEASDSIPDYVRKTYNFIVKHGDAPHGYYGGRNFQNREKRLPLKTIQGQAIHYREWDVHPRRDGIDRGAERLVTGSDGSAWFTSDHYGTFFFIERNHDGNKTRY
jgi:ribonuclease T1